MYPFEFVLFVVEVTNRHRSRGYRYGRSSDMSDAAVPDERGVRIPDSEVLFHEGGELFREGDGEK